MRTFALALLAAVAAAAAKSATGPAVASNLTTTISLEAATSTKTTTVTVGGEVTFAAAASTNQNDIAELAVCYATEKDKHYFCALASFQQLTNANGDAWTAKITPNAFTATTAPAAADFTNAQLFAGSGTANFDATKYTSVATPLDSDVMTVTSDNATGVVFSGTATGAEKASWTWGTTGAGTICTTKTACKFTAARAVAVDTEKLANAELEAVRVFAKTTVAAAAWTANSASASWAHGDTEATDLSAGVAAAAAAAAGAMSPGAVAAAGAAIAALAMAF
jgi:hypothetical protein